MAEPTPEKQVEGRKNSVPKQFIATQVTGTVKWFNVKCGYGFINRNDTKEDVFVHQTAVIKNNPKKAVRSVGDGEIVEFDVVEGEKGHEAANVTGPNGEPVKGSPYAADRRRGGGGGGYTRWYYRPRQPNQRRPGGSGSLPRDGGYENFDNEQVDNGNRRGGGGYGRRNYQPNFYRSGGYNNYRNQRPSFGRNEEVEEFYEDGDIGPVPPIRRGRGMGMGAPRRFFRRNNYRGGYRGPPRRPPNQDYAQGDVEGGDEPGPRHYRQGYASSRRNHRNRPRSISNGRKQDQHETTESNTENSS